MEEIAKLADDLKAFVEKHIPEHLRETVIEDVVKWLVDDDDEVPAATAIVTNRPTPQAPPMQQS